VNLAVVAPLLPLALLGLGLRWALQQAVPGLPTDVLAAGVPGVLLLLFWCFVQEWICTGKALRRERLRADRLEQALLKQIGATDKIAAALVPQAAEE
jgi:hypothetical protein